MKRRKEGREEGMPLYLTYSEDRQTGELLYWKKKERKEGEGGGTTAMAPGQSLSLFCSLPAQF